MPNADKLFDCACGAGGVYKVPSEEPHHPGVEMMCEECFALWSYSARDGLARLREESDEDDDIRMRMAKNLTSIANALRGEPPELTTWSWHDLAEIASALAESQRLADEMEAAWSENPMSTRTHFAIAAYKKHRAEEGQK